MRRGPLFDAWPEWELGKRRRAAAALKLELYGGDYADRVRKLTRQWIADPVVATAVARVVNTAHGLLGAVADACAVCYQRGVRRELVGASPEAARAFAALVGESGMVERAASFNQISWAAGPIVLAPYVEQVRGVPRLALAVCTPDRTEVRRHPAAPDVLTAALWERDDGVLVELTADGWRYFDAHGWPLAGGAVTPHGLDYCPAIFFRSRPWLPADPWGWTDHAGLVDATLQVSFRHALALWLRQQVAVPQVVITAPIAAVPGDQTLGMPTVPLYFNAPPGEVKFEVHERKVNVAECLAEIGGLVNAAVARYGIPPSEVTFENSNSNWGSLAVAVRGERLAAQRDQQVPHLRRAEFALWSTACDVVRASTHRLARVLPDADAVADALRVRFADLATPDEQLKRLEVLAAAEPRGLMTATDLLLQAQPELTRDEADELIRDNLGAYAARLESLVARNVSTDPARGVESIAQVQGREGGLASGDARRAYAPSGGPTP